MNNQQDANTRAGTIYKFRRRPNDLPTDKVTLLFSKHHALKLKFPESMSCLLFNSVRLYFHKRVAILFEPGDADVIMAEIVR